MQRTTRLAAGVDCSTQATKVLLVDPDDGRVVAEGRAPHEVTGSGGARETDPELWWRALRDALAATGRAHEVGSIAVAGQQHGLVVLDGRGRPLRPAMLWNDTRSAPEAADLLGALGAGRWADEVGVVPVASFTVTKWAWLRAHEPEVARAARAVRLPHDFLTERLCGRGVTDRGDASGTGWWSTADESYVAPVLGLPTVGLDPALLPTVLEPHEPAGEVVDAALSELGLAPGTLVAPGTGDNMGAALGLGLVPGEPVLSLGTSGTVYARMNRRTVDPSGTVAGFAAATGDFLPLAATLNATLALDRVAAWLGLDRDGVEPSDGVVVLPYLDGERTPNRPTATGTITGLRHRSSPGSILMAAYEGVVAGLLGALDRLAQQGEGVRPDAPLVLIGGGARGRTWQEVTARLSGRALEVPAHDELVALGAAVQAAAVAGGEEPAAVARRWSTRAGARVEPRRVDVETLERIERVRSASRPLDG